jgi:hypothetical protein
MRVCFRAASRRKGRQTERMSKTVLRAHAYVVCDCLSTRHPPSGPPAPPGYPGRPPYPPQNGFFTAIPIGYIDDNAYTAHGG